jgi:antitoxin MazE
MLVSVIPIDDSKGIKIPNSVLNELNIKNELEMHIYNDEIILKRAEKAPREGWEAFFIEMRNLGDDSLLIPDKLEDDSFEWEW